MTPPFQEAAGSTLWQLAFISFAVVLVLFEILRGWRRGIARQVARLGALIAAYFAAYFGGHLIVPLVRPFFQIPDVVLSILAGAVLALIIYAVVNSLGTILFRRTSQHQSALVRLLCGFGGAVFGLFFGALLVWLIVVGIRSLGSVADVQVREQASNETSVAPGRTLHAVDVRRGVLSESNEEPASLLRSLARLKNSVEMGTFGEAVKKADVVPTNAYETLGKVGKVVSDPDSAQRFLSFPGAHELSLHPKIVALRDDPEIQQLIAQGRYLDLLQDQKIIDAVNDPALFEQIKKFDLQRALDYSIHEDKPQ
jgi:uncharacterized membrane protein required for colicin V production